MSTKRIKFIKAWQMVPVGAEREFDTPVADLLINRKVAEEIKQAPALVVAPVSKKTLKKARRMARANEGK